jgi:hypothetical protein
MLLGISGLAGSGKDTVANMLIEESGFTKVSLADPLKRIARDVYAFTDEQLWGPSEFRNGPDKRYPREDGSYLSPREALQKLGTEWGRECYRNTWVDLCIRTAQTLLEPASIWDYNQKDGLHSRGFEVGIKGVAVPDVRFRNELAAIHGAGGKVIRVSRPGAGLGGLGGMHPSETEQASISDQEFDFVVQNTGTLEDLRIEVRRCLSLLK